MEKCEDHRLRHCLQQLVIQICTPLIVWVTPERKLSAPDGFPTAYEPQIEMGVSSSNPPPQWLCRGSRLRRCASLGGERFKCPAEEAGRKRLAGLLSPPAAPIGGGGA